MCSLNGVQSISPPVSQSVNIIFDIHVIHGGRKLNVGMSRLACWCWNRLPVVQLNEWEGRDHCIAQALGTAFIHSKLAATASRMVPQNLFTRGCSPNYWFSVTRRKKSGPRSSEIRVYWRLKLIDSVVPITLILSDSSVDMIFFSFVDARNASLMLCVQCAWR